MSWIFFVKLVESLPRNYPRDVIDLYTRVTLDVIACLEYRSKTTARDAGEKIQYVETILDRILI